jgi:tetratricopeptide (TPR) repeat protein
MIERKQLDAAQDALRQNVTMHHRGFETDEETAEKCLFVLGGLAYERRDFSETEKWLRQALKAGEAPTSVAGTRARLQLAESYRQLAQAENQKAVDPSLTLSQRNHARDQYQRFLKCAADEYTTLKAFLDTPASSGQLSPEERVRVPFVQAECHFNLGDYPLALDTYARLTERFSIQPLRDPLAARYPELRLEALGGVVRCYAAQGKKEEMRKRLDEIQTSLPFVDESLRRKWDDWLRLARQPLETP